MEAIYKWDFDDNKNRGKFWYIIAISVVIGLSLWGILTKQYGLSFIIILISGIYFFIENNSSDKVEVEINELGIKVDGFFYDFSKIEKYSFIYHGENAILVRFILNKKGLKNIDLKINNNICSELREVLSNYLEESENEELTTSEKFINLLKL